MRTKQIYLAVILLFVGCGDPMIYGPDVALSGGFRLLSTSAYQTQIIQDGPGSGEGVPSEVVSLNWTESIIIAKQRHLKYRNQFPGDKYQIPDPLKCSYWVIDIKSKQTFGPLDEPQFQVRLKSLNSGGLPLLEWHDAVALHK